MKKGILIWKALRHNKNIGDYVQSLAAEQYTGRDVTLVEREHTHEYSGEPLKMIMNGWFMHQPKNWPPSNDIVPYFTSMHINPAISPIMLSEKAIDYFKNYVKNNGPVGARDRGTEALLKSKGIEAYFSGCLTLTLGKTHTHNPESERVCFVDAYYDEKFSKLSIAFWKRFVPLIYNRKAIFKIAAKLRGSTSLGSLLTTASFYKTYSRFFKDEVLVNAEYIKHMILESKFENEESKFECARNLLRKYANSRLVVTSRIHAALPCLAMDTPVIFVINDDLHPDGKGLAPEAKGRFDGLLELFNVMECFNCKLKPILGFKLEGKIGLNHSVRNKKNHLKLAEELEKNCNAFMGVA